MFWSFYVDCLFKMKISNLLAQKEKILCQGKMQVTVLGKVNGNVKNFSFRSFLISFVEVNFKIDSLNRKVTKKINCTQ